MAGGVERKEKSEMVSFSQTEASVAFCFFVKVSGDDQREVEAAESKTFKSCLGFK